jgi:hypothetical protein
MGPMTFEWDPKKALRNRRKKATRKQNNGLRPEYDLSKLKGGVRGKYAQRITRGTNLILLSPDVAEYFPDERSVNTALRSLVGIAKARLTHRRGKTTGRVRVQRASGARRRATAVR